MVTMLGQGARGGVGGVNFEVMQKEKCGRWARSYPFMGWSITMQIIVVQFVAFLGWVLVIFY